MSLPENSPFYPLAADRVILENAHCSAFFDAFPVSPGHALVVPTRCVVSIYDLDQYAQAELWNTVSQVREILKARFNPAGFNIGLNDGPAAGQTIPRAHVHVIPRYTGDVPDPRGGIRWILPQKAKYWD